MKIGIVLVGHATAGIHSKMNLWQRRTAWADFAGLWF